MKFIDVFLFVIVAFTIISCKQREAINVLESKRNDLEKNTITLNQSKSEFVLDNLLQYNSEADLKKYLKKK